MKKVFFVAMICVAGLISAKGTPAKKLNFKAAKTVSKKEVKKKKKAATSKATSTTYTSCGVIVTTTQDWTIEQAIEWAKMIETIYCEHII